MWASRHPSVLRHRSDDRGSPFPCISPTLSRPNLTNFVFLRVPYAVSSTDVGYLPKCAPHAVWCTDVGFAGTRRSRRRIGNVRRLHARCAVSLRARYGMHSTERANGATRDWKPWRRPGTESCRICLRNSYGLSGTDLPVFWTRKNFSKLSSTTSDVLASLGLGSATTPDQAGASAFADTIAATTKFAESHAMVTQVAAGLSAFHAACEGMVEADLTANLEESVSISHPSFKSHLFSFDFCVRVVLIRLMLVLGEAPRAGTRRYLAYGLATRCPVLTSRMAVLGCGECGRGFEDARAMEKGCSYLPLHARDVSPISIRDVMFGTGVWPTPECLSPETG